ncbi:RNA pseudouridylate synthase domain-containing protein 1 [Parasteatoda tepidariorum]|uniref:RNA pseudouridylate synthase domain-containing protein 1 n=1 Tax=Parasteatoda tepidariorum TaxID=114398 RepID=UPI00077FE252|nr:RNA pseudouridylate synthase domain-containing protein 1 [Parasteatoda tepidariorum]
MRRINIKLKWFASHFFKRFVMGCTPPTVNDLCVLHLSDNFLVINKQCDIAINSDSAEDHPITVASQLNHKFPNLADPSIMFGFRFCHRLDFSTSGVLCLALNKLAAKECMLAMNSRRVSKYYLALVHGHIQENSIQFDKPIGFDSRPEHTHKMCVADKDYCIQPRKATSKLIVLQRGTYNEKPATKVIFQLVTGRRHQLRVHSHEIGHTIVGDFTYSDRKDILPYRMFLHSYRIVVPTNLELLDITTDDPFTEDNPKNKWCSLETAYELNNNVYDLFKSLNFHHC